MRNLYPLMFLGTVALFGMGCAPSRFSDDLEPKRPDKISIKITNDNWSDVDVYLLYYGTNAKRLLESTLVTSTTVVKKIRRSELGSSLRAYVFVEPIGWSDGVIACELDFSDERNTAFSITIANHIPTSFCVPW